MTDKNIKPISYADSGVNIDHGNQLVERIKPAVKATSRAGVAGELGGFGGLFDLKACGYKDPVLVSATDGVGTKLRLAIDAGIYNTVGIDLVAMCVNDIIVQGAEPLFFLDYFASGSLEVELACEVIGGIAKGCEIAGAALIGGETAEMPDMYAAKDFDLAGFCVGAAERHKLLDGKKVAAGDHLLGLASSGVHSNGFSLVRKILAQAKAELEEFAPPAELIPLEQTLLTPTRIYVKPLLSALEKHQIHGIAHITGGGISENVPRILPASLGVNIDLQSWKLPPIFRWLMETGPVEEQEMLRTFNCGIGLVLVVPARECTAVKNTLEAAGETVFSIGEVTDHIGDTVVSYTGHLR
jgi:phosphoribosylformylglycinamidine cyclo-ligase